MSGNSQAAQTATVELLTAEVRVLQAGARQVTLSVFRQLDWVDPGEIEPFGRVSDRKPGDYTDNIEVVGSHRGQLARASTKRDHYICGRGFNCPELMRQITAWQAEIPGAPEGFPPWGPSGGVPVRPPTAQDFEDRYGQHPEHEWFAYSDSQELWEEWEQLPLIVLAGLR